MEAPALPPARPARKRGGRWRFLAGLAAASAASFLVLFLAAAGLVAVQAWLKPPPVEFAGLKPAVGEPAPDFVLKDLDGKDYRLFDRRGRTPLVIEFGSATCPYCVAAAEGMDALARKYEGQAEFLFVYCREAHPNQPGMQPLMGKEELPVLPQTQQGEDRAGRARSYCSVKQPTARVLVDVDGAGSVQDLYGGGQNQVIVIDAAGRVALKQTTARVDELDAFLRTYGSAP